MARKSRVFSTDLIIFNIIGYVLLFILALICILPFYLIIVGSFTAEQEIIRYGFSLFPSKYSIEGYKLCLKNPASILRAYGNTTFVTVVGTTIALFITTMTGYVLQRRDFPWRNHFSFFFFFTTLFC